jgi:hypothetical protein
MNADQATLWNGTAGRAWIELQELLDGVFKPLENLLVDAVVAGEAAGSSMSAAGRAPPRSRSHDRSAREAAAPASTFQIP